MKSPKFCFSKKKKDQFDTPDYNLSATENVSMTNDINVFKIKENTSNLSFVVNDSSNNIIDVSKPEVFTQKFSRKTIGVPDTAFDNFINDSSMTSDIALNNKNTSLNEISVSNVNNTPLLSKPNVLNLNHTYDVPINTNYTAVKSLISGDPDISTERQNIVFKKPSNSSILVNENSNNMDVSNTEIFKHKFNQKTIDLTNSAFDNIINDSSMASDITMNNKKTFLNENSMLNKMDIINLNHTYDVLINTDSTSVEGSIANVDDLPRVKQNTVFKSPSNSYFVNDNSNDIMDVSKTEVLIHKFSRKAIDVADSVFDNIINESSIISDKTFNNKVTSSNETLVSNVHDSPGFSKIDISNLNNTYEIPTNINTSKIDVSFANDINKVKVKQNIGLKKFSKSSIVYNDSSNNIMDASKTEVFTHKFSRKIVDVTNSVFDNIINDSSIISDITLNNKKISSPNVNNTPVFNRIDVSSLNHTYNIPKINNTTILDDIVENDKSMSETPVLLKYNTSKSLNLLPLKFNFSNKIGRHSLSYQEKRSSFDGVKKHNISLNTVFIDCAGDKANIFHKSVDNSNVNIDSHSHISKIQENNNSSQEMQPFDDSLLINKLNQEQPKLKSSNSNNEDLLLSNTTKSLESNEFKKNQSKHSISSNSSNEGLTLLNSTTGLLESCSSIRNQSRLLKFKHSKSSISNNNTLNSTMELSDNNESQRTQSKRSISPSYNESLKSTNSTTGFSGRRSSSRNKSSLLISKLSTSIISNNDNTTSLNAATGISVSGRSSKDKSQHSITAVSNNENLTLLNATIGSVENNKSQKIQSKHLKSHTLNIETVSTLKSTIGSLKQNVLSMNQSNGLTSEYSSSIIGGKSSINSLIQEDVIDNVNRMSTRLSKQKSNFQSNIEPETSIIINGLMNKDDITTKNSITEPLEQKVISINQSNSSPNISLKTSTNRLILEDDINYINKIHSLSSKQNHSRDNLEQVIPNITNGSLVENRSSKTRILRSSLHNNKNKSLLTKPLASENVNNLSTDSTKTSKCVINHNNESFNNNSDDSLFWTTLPDETTSISSTRNVNVNTFQTPKSNKLIVAENIINTIKTMSTNKQKSTHPGAFELDDHNDRPLTRSFVKRSYNRRSPSILTLVFGGQKISESTSSLTHSLSETIIDQSQVEENVKQKFKSLYKKESWITKRLYKFLIIKLQPNYNIYSVKYAEKFVKYLAMLLKQIYDDKVNLQLYSDMLRYHMARYGIIKDTFDYLGFLSDYLPMAYYKKLVPGWNLETSAVKFNPQKYYIPLMDDEEFLNYIMKHLKEA
ncbi:putative uncharacterized protein DDB_G0282133 isoform X3 [Melanaphis sacchari]|nr:putative uncharacterized protein DDB_G0282133 isoform X3 [Melanaphis sacchari]